MDDSPQPASVCGILRRVPVFNRQLETAAVALAFIDCGEHATDPRALLRQGLLHLGETPTEAMFGALPVVIDVPPSALEAVLDTRWPLASKILNVDAGDSPPAQWRATLEAIAQRGFEHVLNHGAAPGDPPLRPKLWSMAGEAAAAPGSSTSPPHVWAQRIDTRDAFQIVQANDSVDWISGEFWKRPAIQAPRSLPASQVGALRLLAKLQNPDVSVNEVEQIVSCDTTLTYKLLKLLNSAFFCAPSRVQSIHHGVTFFGLQRIKNWATVIVMNAVDFLPHEILPLGAYRAHLTEVLAQALKRPNAPQYYLVGLFSVLDALFDCKMEQLIAPLNLHDEIARALLTHDGPAGELLDWVISTETGQPVWPEGLLALRELDLLRIQLDALAWTSEFCRCVGGA